MIYLRAVIVLTAAVIFLVFCLVPLNLLFSSEVTAQQPEKNVQAFTLTRLGYPNDIRLEGSDPTFVFYVPVVPGVDFSKSVFNLHLTFSPVLNPGSSVKVFVADNPVYTVLLRDLLGTGQEVSIKVPLAGVTLPAASDMLKVEVRFHLYITRNICQDLATGNLWAVLHNDSHVILSGATYQPQSVADFLNGSFKRVYIMLPKTVSPETATCYLKTYAFLRRLFRDRGVVVETLLPGQPPADTASPHIIIEDSGSNLILDENRNLRLGPGAVDAFISSLRALFLGRRVEVTTARTSTPDEVPVKILLEDLGYSPVTVRGVGDLKAAYTFTISDLGGWPTSMRLVLFGRYTPLVEKNSKDMLYLKVYLNGLLLKALPLDGKGEINGLSVSIPDYSLRQENTLELIYAYYREVGDCVEGTMPFEGLFCNRSYLELSGHRKDDYLSFSSIPASFTGAGYVVLPEKDTLSYLLAAGDLLAAVRQMDRAPIQVQVVFTPGNENQRELSGKGWLLLILPPEMLKQFRPPVDISGNRIIIYNPLTKEQFFEVTTDEALGIAQVYYVSDQTPAIALSFHGQGISEMQALAHRLANPDNLRRLRGNIALFRNDQLVGFDVGKKMRARVEGEKDLWYYYHRYRVPIFVGLLAILSILAYIVYIRLARYPANR
jgi:hypothetical protein